MARYLKPLGSFCGSNDHGDEFTRFHQTEQAMHITIAQRDGLRAGLQPYTHIIGCHHMGHLPFASTFSHDEKLRHAAIGRLEAAR